MKITMSFCDYCGIKLSENDRRGVITVTDGETGVQAELCPGCTDYLYKMVSSRMQTSEKAALNQIERNT